MAELRIRRLDYAKRTTIETVLKEWRGDQAFHKIIDTIGRISIREGKTAFLVIEDNFQDSFFEDILATTQRLLIQRYRLAPSRDQSSNYQLSRLHFFLGDPPEEKVAVDELNTFRDGYLGYCILCKWEGEQRQSVVHSLIQYSRLPGQHGYFMELGVDFPSEIKDSVSGESVELTIRNAFPFVRQDRILRCCANVVVEMCSWALDHAQGPLSPQRQVDILKQLDNGKPLIPTTGLNITEIEALIKDFANVQSFTYGTEPTKLGLTEEPIERLIYRHVESGFPVILLDIACKHSIVLYGHNINPDLWSEVAERTYFGKSLKYYSVSHWVTHFIATNDNLGVYYDLPVSYLRSMVKERPVAFVAMTMVPKNYGIIKISGNSAETAAFTIVEGLVSAIRSSASATKMPENFGILFDHLEKSELVLRPQLVERKKLLKENGRLRGYNPLYRFYDQIEDLPAVMWLVEFTTPELYVNYHECLGEVILDAHVSPVPDSLKGISCAHIPGLAVDYSPPHEGEGVFLPKDRSYPMFSPMWKELSKSGWAL